MYFFIFSIIFFGIGCFLFYQVNQIKIQKNQQQEEYYQQLQKNITQADVAYTEKLKQHNKEWQQLQEQIAFKKQGIDNELSQYRKDIIQQKEQELQELLQEKQLRYSTSITAIQHDNQQTVDKLNLQIKEQQTILQNKLTDIKQTIRILNERRMQ